MFWTLTLLQFKFLIEPYNQFILLIIYLLDRAIYPYWGMGSKISDRFTLLKSVKNDSGHVFYFSIKVRHFVNIAYYMQWIVFVKTNLKFNSPTVLKIILSEIYCIYLKWITRKPFFVQYFFNLMCQSYLFVYKWK